MNTKRAHYVTFGPPIPVVPVGDFSQMRMTDQQWADAWHLCGPSAARNLSGARRGRSLELWQVIASAYLEGLQHGVEIERERHAQPSGQVQRVLPTDAA